MANIVTLSVRLPWWHGLSLRVLGAVASICGAFRLRPSDTTIDRFTNWYGRLISAHSKVVIGEEWNPTTPPPAPRKK